MILAEKITQLRKRCGWSQEELAFQLGISRQSVSKWESGTSIPDLDKIIKMSNLFGVSTDYLLKDEMESITLQPGQETDTDAVGRSVSAEEAGEFMETSRTNSKWIALGVALCILSPVTLIELAGVSEFKETIIHENIAAAIGVAALLIFIAAAVALFIIFGSRLDKYEYMGKEVISLQYGVKGIVEKKKEAFQPRFVVSMVSGVVLCILSVIPLIVTSLLGVSNLVTVSCVSLMLAVIAGAVWLFVNAGIIYDSYQKLLQAGDYTSESKKRSSKTDAFAGAYWCTVTAIYLGYNFITNNWDISWVIWPVAALLFVAISAILNAFVRSNDDEK